MVVGIEKNGAIRGGRSFLAPNKIDGAGAYRTLHTLGTVQNNQSRVVASVLFLSNTRTAPVFVSGY